MRNILDSREVEIDFLLFETVWCNFGAWFKIWQVLFVQVNGQLAVN